MKKLSFLTEGINKSAVKKKYCRKFGKKKMEILIKIVIACLVLIYILTGIFSVVEIVKCAKTNVVPGAQTTIWTAVTLIGIVYLIIELIW